MENKKVYELSDFIPKVDENNLCEWEEELVDTNEEEGNSYIFGFAGNNFILDEDENNYNSWINYRWRAYSRIENTLINIGYSGIVGTYLLFKNNGYNIKQYMEKIYTMSEYLGLNDVKTIFLNKYKDSLEMYCEYGEFNNVQNTMFYLIMYKLCRKLEFIYHSIMNEDKKKSLEVYTFENILFEIIKNLSQEAETEELSISLEEEYMQVFNYSKPLKFLVDFDKIDKILNSIDEE